jgi:oligopeptide transport system substrate-binding protein
VELANEEWKVYLSTLRTRPAPIFRLGWLADFPDPDNFMGLMTSASENNHTGWKSKTYDDMVSRAAALLDKEERRKIYSQAQKLLTEDDVPTMPIYSMVKQVMASDRVQGLTMNSMEHILFRGVSLK